MRDSEQVFMYFLTELLGGGDDGGQDTAVYDKLHEELLLFRVKILNHNLFYFRFVLNICCSECSKSSSTLIQ